MSDPTFPRNIADTAEAVIAAVLTEMRHRAEDGCVGDDENGVCCGEESEMHPDKAIAALRAAGRREV